MLNMLNSLVVQWLEFHALTTKGLGSIPGTGIRSHKLHSTVKCSKKKKKHPLPKTEQLFSFLEEVSRALLCFLISMAISWPTPAVYKLQRMNFKLI